MEKVGRRRQVGHLPVGGAQLALFVPLGLTLPAVRERERKTEREREV
jgi:hypothetical protein